MSVLKGASSGISISYVKTLPYPISATYDPSNGYTYVLTSDGGASGLPPGHAYVFSGTTLVANITISGLRFYNFSTNSGTYGLPLTYDPSNGYLYGVASYSGVFVISGTSYLGIVPGTGYAGQFDNPV